MAGTLYILRQVTIPEIWRLPLFILGVSAVALYLAVAVSYLVFPKSFWKRLAMVLNGPLLALIGLVLWPGPALQLVTATMLIEVGGTCLALFLVVITEAPSSMDRRMGMVVTGLPLGLVMAASTGYLHHVQAKPLAPAIYLLLSVLQLGLTRRSLVSRDGVQRQDLPILLIGILAWVAAFILGNVLSDI